MIRSVKFDIELRVRSLIRLFRLRKPPNHFLLNQCNIGEKIKRLAVIYPWFMTALSLSALFKRFIAIYPWFIAALKRAALCFMLYALSQPLYALSFPLYYHRFISVIYYWFITALSWTALFFYALCFISTALRFIFSALLPPLYFSGLPLIYYRFMFYALP